MVGLGRIRWAHKTCITVQVEAADRRVGMLDEMLQSIFRTCAIQFRSHPNTPKKEAKVKLFEVKLFVVNPRFQPFAIWMWMSQNDNMQIMKGEAQRIFNTTQVRRNFLHIRLLVCTGAQARNTRQRTSHARICEHAPRGASSLSIRLASRAFTSLLSA